MWRGVAYLGPGAVPDADIGIEGLCNEGEKQKTMPYHLGVASDHTPKTGAKEA